jgi:hypothetical protein
MHHSDIYNFATGYWWLIFPLGWGAIAMLRIWVRHRQSMAILELMKVFIDQGKEPPAALVERLDLQTRPAGLTYQPLHFWLSALLLAAGAIGFTALTWLRARQGDPDSSNALFLAIFFAAAAMACAVFAMIVQARHSGNDAS